MPAGKLPATARHHCFIETATEDQVDDKNRYRDCSGHDAGAMHHRHPGQRSFRATPDMGGADGRRPARAGPRQCRQQPRQPGVRQHVVPVRGNHLSGTETLNISSNGFISLGGDNGDGYVNLEYAGDPAALVGGAFRASRRSGPTSIPTVLAVAGTSSSTPSMTTPTPTSTASSSSCDRLFRLRERRLFHPGPGAATGKQHHHLRLQRHRPDRQSTRGCPRRPQPGQ